MTYETVQTQTPHAVVYHTQEEWQVVAIDFDGDGDIFVATFSGLCAHDRAEEYAAWKNSRKLP